MNTARHAATLALASALIGGSSFAQGQGSLNYLPAPDGPLTLASTGSRETSANGPSYGSSISGAGRFVLFQSEASDLTPDVDHNGLNLDVFLYDNVLHTKRLVSRSINGGTGDGESRTGLLNGRLPVMSFDGRYSVFLSAATDLTEDPDTNGAEDVFLYDRIADSVTLVSKTPEGAAGNGRCDPFFSISGTGRYIAFQSNSSDLTADVDTNGHFDVFLYDRVSDTTTLVSSALSGDAGNGRSQYPIISLNGSAVVFDSTATDLTPEARVAFADAFYWDRTSGNTTLLSKTPAGVGGNLNSFPRSLSANGRYVVVESFATDLTKDPENNVVGVDIFLYDRENPSLRLVSRSMNGGTANDRSSGSSISADGRFIVFESPATDLTADVDNNSSGDGVDIYLYDALLNDLELVSTGLAGGTANDKSERPIISLDGRWVVFSSEGSDLTTDTDANGEQDVFLWERRTGEMRLVSRAAGGSTGNDWAGYPSLSYNGLYVSIDTKANDVTQQDDQNNETDVAVYSRRSINFGGN